MQQDSLPKPDETSAAHSARVAVFIRERIDEAGGSISFAEFMQYALYAPGLGYYTAGSTKFGEAGDFITAPEISAVFGDVIGRQSAEVLTGIGGGCILEYGAGSGKLAADVLRVLGACDILPETYLILEVSPDLRERQAQYIHEQAPGLAGRVHWLDAPPSDLRGVIIANEVLDALPVERFVRREHGVMQQRVKFGEDGFEFAEAEAPAQLTRAVIAVEEETGERLPEGFVSEICLAVPGWIQQMSSALQQGVAFLFDYGVSRREYYAAARQDGWLRCHFRHHAHNNSLIFPGIQDLTAWVDFSGVAHAAVEAGFEIAGYAAQAQFMMAGGLEQALSDFADLSLEEQLELSQQVKTLTLPGEMGEHFKCMALRKGLSATPSAFGLADRTHTL